MDYIDLSTILDSFDASVQDDTVYLLPKGEYYITEDKTVTHFYYQANNDSSLKKIAFYLKKKKNIVLDFNNSRLIFCGRISPFIFDGCENITLKNVIVDYDRPFYSEGIITDSGDDYFTLNIDKDKFPYTLTNKKGIIFNAPYWEQNIKSGINLFLEFDAKRKQPAYNSVLAIAACGEDAQIDERSPIPMDIYTVNETVDGGVKFSGRLYKKLKAGNTLVITHEKRENSIVFALNCKGLVFNNVEVVHSGAMGIICQTCSDINVNKFVCRLSEYSKGSITLNCDALHFVNCDGYININDSVFENMMDDAVNVHGIYTFVEYADKNTLKLKLMHFQQYGINVFKQGDKINLSGGGLKGAEIMTVKSSELINEDTVEVICEETVSPAAVGGIAENISRMPDVTIRNSKAGNNRPRGYLISSPKKVLIEGNTFYTSSFALFFAGDSVFWYESGGVKNVEIRNNTFNDCGYHYGDYPIAFLPVCGKNQKNYHSNILIENNTFNVFTDGILYCKNTDKLVYRNNKINKSNIFPKRLSSDKLVTENCGEIKFIEE